MRSTQVFGPGSPGEPSPAELEAWRRRMGPPSNEVGCAVPVSAILGRAPDAAVAVTRLTAYTTGVSFDVAVRLRVLPADVQRHGLFDLISHHHRPDLDMDPNQQLLLGVEYADGRTALNTGLPGWPPGTHDDDQEPMLVPSGGGGDDLGVDQTFWLTPVPPDGSFTFVCSWQALGIDETRLVIEPANLTQASQRAVQLWPWQPVNHDTEQYPEPKLPSSGWFGDAARRQRDIGR